MEKRIVIIGAGESGTGAAILAKKQGFDVFVSDIGKIKAKYQEMLYKNEIEWEEERHTEKLILNADEIVKSPGVSDKTDIMVSIISKEIYVISEIEFAARYTAAKKICVTGSNGKTTTTSLIHYMMRKAGLNVALAGNIGSSFAMQVATENYDYYVLELSSFQLDNMFNFKADIAILLNITPDHLDRYDYELQKYVDSKFRIIQNLEEDEYFIFCSDDEITVKQLEKIVVKARQLPYSVKKKENDGAYINDDMMNIEFDEVNFSMSLNDLSLKGRHNVYNSMAAGIAGSVLKIRNEVIRDSLSQFKGIEHRLEPVINVNGIEFINDSKATNINSTWYALECMPKQTVWIVGGIDKGNDYTELSELVKTKVKAIVCLGKDNDKIKTAFAGTVETIIETQSMKDAVKSAYYLAKKGDSVLLSPACASFDLFDNYEDRGRQFKECVKEL